jgi:hypothetical protein
MPNKDHIFHFQGNLPSTIRRVLWTWIQKFRTLYGEHNIVRLSLSEQGTQVIQELVTPPFLAEKRLILIDGRLDECSPKMIQELKKVDWADVFWRIPETNVLAWLQIDTTIPSLLEILNTHATLKSYSIHSPEEVENYIRKALPNLNPKSIRLLQERLWDTPLLLENEIEKLGLLGMMNEEELRENTLETTEVKVFAVGDALVSGDTRRAIELVRASLLTMDAGEFLRGSSVGSVRKKWFLAVLREIWLYGFLARHFMARERNAILGLKDFVGEKYARIPEKRLHALGCVYKRIAEIDLLLKTGKLVWDESWIQHQIEKAILEYNFKLQAK